VCCQKTELKRGRPVAAIAKVIFLTRRTNGISSVNVGGQIGLEFTSQNESMSVLVPGEGDIIRRACLGQRAQELETWFACVEANAWAYVNASCETRPTKIFLVTGQTLTTHYAICHQESGTFTCEVHVEADVEVPSVLNANVLVGHTWGNVSASTGFQVMTRGGNDLHSIFFKVFESYPTTFIRKASRRKRLLQLHR
jgi:hypothetical protein